MPGGSALTYEIELDREILSGPVPYRFRMLSSAPIMVDAELQLRNDEEDRDPILEPCDLAYR